MFRKASVDAQSMRSNGVTVEAQGFASGPFTYFIAALVAVAIGYIVFANYSRTITVQGVIRPKGGLASVVPSRPGSVSKIHVQAGDFVEEGAKIFTINPREGGLDTTYREEPVIKSLDIQARLIRDRKGSAKLSNRADISALELQRRKIQSEMKHAEGRLKIQTQLNGVAKEDFERAQKLHSSGFVSTRELEERRGRLLTSELEFSVAQQNLDNSRADVAEINIQIDRLQSRFMEEAATIDSSIEQLEQAMLQIEGEGIYTLRAPMSGSVTAMNVREGERANIQQELAQIVRNDSEYEAQLYVLSNSIGFVKPGQSVRIGLDTFPFEKFGTISGTVREVSQSGASITLAGQETAPYFLVKVDLEKQTKLAYGENVRLLPGMTLKAWIIAEKQSFFEWLFSPIYAIRNRKG